MLCVFAHQLASLLDSFQSLRVHLSVVTPQTKKSLSRVDIPSPVSASVCSASVEDSSANDPESAVVEEFPVASSLPDFFCF